MKGKEVIEDIRKAVNDIKRNNQDVISVSALLNYIDALEKDSDQIEEIDSKKHETDLTIFRAEHERNIAHYNAQQLHAVEMFKSVISYGAAALKSAILINGGGAAALLAFIGNIWTKGIAQAAVGPLTSSISYFSFGVLVAAIGTAGSYFTQYYYNEGYARVGIAFHVLTGVLVVGSYVLFGLGAAGAYETFVEHLTPNWLHS